MNEGQNGVGSGVDADKNRGGVLSAVRGRMRLATRRFLTSKKRRGGGDRRNPLSFPQGFPQENKGWRLNWKKMAAGLVVLLAVFVGWQGMSQDTYADGDPTYDCMASGASESLGWGVCPVLTWMSGASNNLYNDWVKPALQVDPKLFTQKNTDGDNATLEGWKVFRNIANSVLIILLLGVIFSQLTGVGIDNYGIKKILPKLIVAAVLMNLSYWLCVALVDVSNIFGNSLQAMFNGWAEGIKVPNKTGGVDIASFLGNGTLVWAGVLVALASGVWATIATGGGGALAIMLLLAAISVVATLFALFLLLAVREAAIVVLVMLAPLAFACYMLPNTKNMFDRWKKLGEGLLLVYPIAGLLVGGGNFVSRVLLASGGATDGFFPAFAAIIAGIVPIFFIPMLLKNSFSAMGNLGAKIMGMGKTVGNRVGGNVGKSLQNSDRFQRMSNAIDMKMPSKRLRANAVKSERARASARSEIERLSDRGNMQTMLEAGAAADEMKAVDATTAERLSLMQSTGENGGIVMADGTRKAYTLANMRDRMSELEKDSRTRALTGDERLEMSALARGMAAEKGGAGMLGKIIRAAETTDPNTGAKKANANFMSAMGEIYTRDAAVQSKMREKESGASIYTEQFMAGGAGAGGSTFSDFQKGAEYKSEMGNRVKSHAVGLSQGGAAFDEYLSGLTAGGTDASGAIVQGSAEYSQAASEFQKIMDNEDLVNSLDDADRIKLENEAAKFGVTGKSARTVEFAEGSKEMSALDATAANTGDAVISLGDINANAAQTAANTSNINDGVLQIQSHAAKAANNAGMVDVGFIKDRNGNMHHVRQTGDGRYVDDQGHDMGSVDPSKIVRR